MKNRISVNQLVVLGTLLFATGIHVSSAQTVVVSGAVEVPNAPNNGGVEIYFEPLSPSSRAETIYSNADGSWFKSDIQIGIYNIRFAIDGYVPDIIPNVFIDRDTTFAVKTLRVGGATEITGNLFGTREGNTITLSGDTLYFVRTDLSVDNKTLRIMPGAELKFDKDTGLTITNGRLEIPASVEDSVIFTSGAPVPNFGDWKGVFVEGGEGHEINNAYFEYGQINVYFNNATDITLNGVRSDKPLLHAMPFRISNSSRVSISNSYFTALERPGLAFQNTETLSIEGTRFYGGSSSLVLRQVSDDVQIIENVFDDYNGRAISDCNDWDGGCASNNNGDLYIKNNVFKTTVSNDVTVRLSDTRNVQFEQNDFEIHILSGNNVGGIIHIGNGRIVDNDAHISGNHNESAYHHDFVVADGGAIINNYLRSTATYSGYFLYMNGGGDKEGSRVEGNEIVYDVERIGRYCCNGRFNDSESMLRIYNVALVRGNKFEIILDNLNGNYNQRFYIRNADHIEHNDFVVWQHSHSYNMSLMVQNDSPQDINFKNNVVFAGVRGGNEEQLFTLNLSGLIHATDNTIIGGNGILSSGQPNRATISNNLIVVPHRTGDSWGHNYDNHYRQSTGISIRASSQVEVRNNTIIGDSKVGATGVGIESIENSRPTIVNNHIHWFENGISLASEPGPVAFNNFSEVSNVATGSFSVPFLGSMSTKNHNGVASDIYYNTAEAGGFDTEFGMVYRHHSEVYDDYKQTGEVNYFTDALRFVPQSNSHLVNGGSGDYIDPDGTRSDIGAIPFDFGNPKYLTQISSDYGTATVSFQGVDRDSVLAYTAYGSYDENNLTEIRVIAKTDSSFVLEGLDDNTPYFVEMRTEYPNSSSIPSSRLEVLAGKAELVASTNQIRYVSNDASIPTQLAEVSVENVGTRSASVMIEPINSNATPTVIEGYEGPELIGSKAYYYYGGRISWSQARDYASSRGLLLAIPKNQAENEAIRQMGRGHELWLGGYKETDCDGNIVDWLDGSDSRTGYTNWSQGQPDNGCGERFMHMFTSGTWNDAGGGSYRHVAQSSRSISSILQETRVIAANEASVFSDTLKYSPQFYGQDEWVITSPAVSDTIRVFVKQITGVEQGGAGVFFNGTFEGDFYHDVIIKNISIDGQQPVAGDEIGLFDGDKLIASASLTGTFPLHIPILTEATGPITARVFLAQTSELVSVLAEVDDGDTEYAPNGFTVVLFSGTQREEIDLRLAQNRFSLVSMNVQPVDAQVQSVFGNAAVQIVQDDNGGVWIPSFNIDRIGALDVSKGYQVFTAGMDTSLISISGKPLVPSEVDITLRSSRFNLLPMVYQTPVSVEGAFASIANQIEIVQNDQGEAWIPALSINTLGELVPGKGYQAFLDADQDISFSFPDVVTGKRTAGRDARVATNSRYDQQIIETGLPWLLVIQPDASWDEWYETGTELSLWSQSGVVVGANQLARDEPTMITAWQGDTGTGLPGFETNEPIIARLWHPTLELETTVPLIGVSGESLRFGEGPYGIATIPQYALSTGAEEIPPASFGLESAFPNPFQSLLSLRISVPTTESVSVEVYNLLGQRVAQLSNGVFEAGVHDLMWRASEKSAGVYIIKVVSPLGSIVKLVTKVD